MRNGFVPLAAAAALAGLALYAAPAHAQASAYATLTVSSMPSGYTAQGDVEYEDLMLNDKDGPSNATTYSDGFRIDANVSASDSINPNDIQGSYHVYQIYQYGTGTPPGGSVTGTMEAYGHCSPTSFYIKNQSGSSLSPAVDGMTGAANGYCPNGTDLFYDDSESFAIPWGYNVFNVDIGTLMTVYANSDPN